MVQSSPTIPTSPRQTVPQSPDNAIEVPTSLPTVATEDLEEYDDDGDSAFGSAKSDATDTPSMTSSILKYREEYGRTYHAFGSTDHWGPNEEDAQEQQDMSHHFWSLILKGDLYVTPVNNPHRILDVGTGTGIDAAEQHPEADVKGIDVSPIQPSELLGSVPDWPKSYVKSFRALKPGGWIDCSEPGLYFESFFGTLGEGHPYKPWGTAMLEAENDAGLSFDVAPYIKGRLENAGFINVVEKKVCCTIGRWSQDPWEKEVGLWEQLRLKKGVQFFCDRRFINNRGLS
ncbi:uncharacterized protein RCO7_01189 [Rhynchosporium graminicola]|uniref:TAM domain methyltransferase n=1 Tax=Rhynchosporium graminicola TaxID=2792576 RepID=A0A1E1JRG4_9HELO|nr:uncharacterized protein RCO7_01189 [Rhynchosporium commune]